jgi:hypothetical protein
MTGPMRSSRMCRAASLIACSMCALWLAALQGWTQNHSLGGGDRAALTHAQRSVVDRIARATASEDVSGESSERRLARLALPLADGGKIKLAMTRPLLWSDRGLTWRGIIEDTGERTILMLRRDGQLSGYFAYQGSLFRVALVEARSRRRRPLCRRTTPRVLGPVSGRA